MQRDFVEEGGFGSTLGNNVKLLQAIVPTVQLLLVSARSQASLTLASVASSALPSAAAS
jgi:hypothetical protein